MIRYDHSNGSVSSLSLSLVKFGNFLILDFAPALVSQVSTGRHSALSPESQTVKLSQPRFMDIVYVCIVHFHCVLIVNIASCSNRKISTS